MGTMVKPPIPCKDGYTHRLRDTGVCVVCGLAPRPATRNQLEAAALAADRHRRRLAGEKVRATISQEDMARRLTEGIRLTFGQKTYIQLRMVYPDECFYCQQPLTDKNRTLDHYYPRSSGGLQHIDNLRLCCMSCNDAKKNMPPEEFIERLAAGRGPGSLWWHYKPKKEAS